MLEVFWAGSVADDSQITAHRLTPIVNPRTDGLARSSSEYTSFVLREHDGAIVRARTSSLMRVFARSAPNREGQDNEALLRYLLAAVRAHPILPLVEPTKSTLDPRQHGRRQLDKQGIIVTRATGHVAPSVEAVGVALLVG